MNRSIITAAASVAIAISASQLPGATIAWQGGSGTLNSGNYTDGTNPNLSPQAADTLNFGFGGTATHSSGALSVAKFRVGHNDATAGALQGSGNVTIGAGASVTATGGSGASNNAGVWVGNAQDGTLTLDGGTLTSNNSVAIGAGNTNTPTGTLNIKNGGALNITTGTLSIGDRSGTSGNGVKGVLKIEGATSTITGVGFQVGIRARTSSYEQVDGTVNFSGNVEVGPATGSSNGSNFKLSGGTFATGGSFFMGRGDSLNSSLTVNGGTLNVTSRLLIGGGSNTAAVTGTVVNHSAGTVATTLDVRIADAYNIVGGDSTYNLSGTGVLNATTGMIVGRQGTGKMLQTGGSATLNGALTIANIAGAATPITTSGLYKISGGSLTVTAGTALNVGVTNVGEFRVVGDDSTIDLNGNLAVTTAGSTLAFELETGDLLSMMDVSGTATFAAGTILNFDATNAAPTQTVYNLLTASSITNNGFTFTQPGTSGWSYQIISGGNGQILQVVVPEPATFGLAAMAGMMLLARRRKA